MRILRDIGPHVAGLSRPGFSERPDNCQSAAALRHFAGTRMPSGAVSQHAGRESCKISRDSLLGVGGLSIFEGHGYEGVRRGKLPASLQHLPQKVATATWVKSQRSHRPTKISEVKTKRVAGRKRGTSAQDSDCESLTNAPDEMQISGPVMGGCDLATGFLDDSRAAHT
jgi:hypothetical protein